MTEEELAALFVETGHRHHEAFLASDGVDPEWANWYSGYIQAHLWDRLGRLLTRSEIAHVLLLADAQVRNDPDQADDWPTIYARCFAMYAATPV